MCLFKEGLLPLQRGGGADWSQGRLPPRSLAPAERWEGWAVQEALSRVKGQTPKTAGPWGALPPYCPPRRRGSC